MLSVFCVTHHEYSYSKRHANRFAFQCFHGGNKEGIERALCEAANQRVIRAGRDDKSSKEVRELDLHQYVHCM